ncbi:MAG: DNA recombination protein RmuC [Gammaproteobacteria bacterium]|nr:DNA recombination protein RmuC [Gammaproteobacteria bacterium]MDP2139297.1 DNA recombination protein RmuC [Gammaproteobacteria bacterium]MDP2346782.1 DNA recombination protein RmuC [Gammaproteobacteria bacterium]
MEMTPAFVALTVLAVILASLCILMYLRRPPDQSGAIAVLEERLQSRQLEIDNHTQRIRELQADAAALSESSTRYREQITQLQTTLEQERKLTAEKLALLNDSREQMTLQFKTIANEILEDKSQRFTVSNRESINEILKPLNEKIQHFEKRVEETYDRESKERFSLAREIRSLQELNVRISEDATNLTNALKGESKTQGTWGEVILESILEKSGLVKGREYETQLSLKAEDGSRSQPDVVVHMPENKHIIIDAKVSLKAYESFCSESDSDLRNELLRQHVQSVRSHVKSLSSKEYQNLMELNSLDFVLLFMPVEAAFSVAVQQDGELFTSAFEKNIILVGPSTLLATLRTIQNIWRYEHQSQNAIEIANSAGALYDKFVAFVVDLDDIGNRINATQKSFDKAHNKLISGKGNLVSRIEKLKLLGARASKKHAERTLVRADAEEPEQLEDNSQ